METSGTKGENYLQWS